MVLNLPPRPHLRKWASLLILLGSCHLMPFVILLKMALVVGISGAVRFCRRSQIFSNHFMCSILQNVALISFRILLLHLAGVCCWHRVKLMFGSTMGFSMCSAMPNPSFKRDCAKARSPLTLRCASKWQPVAVSTVSLQKAASHELCC